MQNSKGKNSVKVVGWSNMLLTLELQSTKIQLTTHNQ